MAVASEKTKIKTVMVPEKREVPDGVVLELTQEEADLLRCLLAIVDYRDGLYDVFTVLRPYASARGLTVEAQGKRALNLRIKQKTV